MIEGETHECRVQGNSLQHIIFTAVSKPFDLEKECWYIDGSSYYKDGNRISGFAGVCVKDGGVQRQFSYSCRARSAQYVEIAVFLQVLIELRDDGGIVNIASDSDQVCKGAVVYLSWWNVMGFKGTDGSEIRYASLWKMIEEETQFFSKISIRKVQAHRKQTTEHYWNNTVDRLAKEAAVTSPEWPHIEHTLSFPVSALTRAQAK